MFLEEKILTKVNIFENNSLPIKRIFPDKKFFPKETGSKVKTCENIFIANFFVFLSSFVNSFKN